MRLLRRGSRVPMIRIDFPDGGTFIVRADAIHWDRWFGVTLPRPP